jgi:hypothetical protein
MQDQNVVSAALPGLWHHRRRGRKAGSLTCRNAWLAGQVGWLIQVNRP